LNIEETEEGVVLSSSVDPSKFANALDFSFETLQNFGIVDVVFKNLVNPDSNRKEKIDFDENLKWEIFPGYAANNNGDLYDKTWIGFKMKNRYPDFIENPIYNAELEPIDNPNIEVLLHGGLIF
jgi:hypothetical protein